MSRKAAGNQVGKAIMAALDAELIEIQRRHEEDVSDASGKLVAKKGDFLYDLMDRGRVYDRVLKLEGLKLKAEDPEWGEAYRKPAKGGETSEK